MDCIITSYCHLHDNKVIVNDRLIYYQENILKFADLLKSVYKQEQIVYPKFYKMDAISKLGFVTAELVLKEKSIEGYLPGMVGVCCRTQVQVLIPTLYITKRLKTVQVIFQALRCLFTRCPIL